MKDSIAFAAVILTCLLGGFAAFAFNPREPIDKQVLSLLNVEWFRPATPAEVRHVEPIILIGYRDPLEQHPPKVANAPLKPVLEANVIDARLINH